MQLHDAIRSGDSLRVKQLLERGTDPNQTGDSGETPLHTAAACCRLDAVRLLLQFGADPNRRVGSHFETPLHKAASTGCTDIVRHLLERGGDPHGNGGDDAALYWAARHGHAGTVRVLLTYGADANARGYRDMTALHSAAECGHADVVDVLLDAGADPGALDRFGDSPWHVASIKGHAQIARRLREAMNSHPLLENPPATDTAHPAAAK